MSVEVAFRDSLEYGNEDPETGEDPASGVADAIVPDFIVVVVVVGDGIVRRNVGIVAESSKYTRWECELRGVARGCVGGR